MAIRPMAARGCRAVVERKLTEKCCPVFARRRRRPIRARGGIIDETGDPARNQPLESGHRFDGADHLGAFVERSFLPKTLVHSFYAPKSAPGAKRPLPAALGVFRFPPMD